MGREQRYVAVVASLLVGLAALGGCGTASPETAPTGVDGLTVPTPSPDPADFVPRIDNPWLPYAPGAVWTYEVSGAAEATVTVAVLDSEEIVAGVATTAVARTGEDGVRVVDLFAQDRDGNVWWFAREGQWRAGEGGAEAGLAMPAAPRRGDGWRAAYAEGTVDVRVSVVATDESVTTPAGRFTDLLTLEVDPVAGEGARSLYARGVGLVAEVTTEGPVRVLELLSAPADAG